MTQQSSLLVNVGKKLNENVFSVISSNGLTGFERAFQLATATEELKKLLTAEYMKPIMALQGNKLGFKTDKDNTGGYPVEVVKNCLIEAVLTGVQPFGNQFNIIAGNCYITKEGFGHLLSKVPGLRTKFIPGLPRVNSEKTGAAVPFKIKWSLHGGDWKEQDLEIPVKLNAYMGTDGAIGKATRKARAWLFNNINDIEIADGDVTDVEAKVISTKINKEEERINTMIAEARTSEDLDKLGKHIDKFTPEQIEAFTLRKEELKK